jgi:hypothetical protein
MTDTKITLTVAEALNKKIERAAEEKFQTVEQFILDCVAARLSGGAKALSAGAGLEDILTFSEFSEWLDNQYHFAESRVLAEIVKTFVAGESMPAPVKAKTR